MALLFLLLVSVARAPADPPTPPPEPEGQTFSFPWPPDWVARGKYQKMVLRGITGFNPGQWDVHACGTLPDCLMPAGPLFNGLLSYSFNDASLPNGDFETNLAMLRANFSFTAELSWNNFLQWDDEWNDRQSALDLFDAFGSTEKTLYANMGGHTGVPEHADEGASRFFARHLGSPVG